jgi:hypothetical protein
VIGSPRRLAVAAVVGLAAPAALAALTTLATLAAGCVDHSLARIDPESSRIEIVDLPLPAPPRYDLLFVVDDSRSMAAEQAALATDFPKLMDVLSQIQGGLPDLHLGVVTTDLGDGGGGLPGCAGAGDGGVMRGAACPALGGAAYLVDERLADGTRLRDYTGSIADAFACMAEAGTAGCAIEQPLETMRRALDPGLGLAPGFLRDDAELVVAIISDEDDCSVRDPSIFDGSGPAAARAFACTTEGLVCDEPDLRAPGVKHGCRPRDGAGLHDVAGYVQFLRGLKYDPSMVHVAAAIGDDAPVVVGGDPGAPVLLPSCSSDAGAATPALRTAAFVAGFGSHGDRSSLCAPDLSDLLVGLATLLREVIGDPCFRGQIADVDPGTPGLQPTCAVTLTTRDGTTRAATQVVPACAGAPDQTPCWRTAEDPVQCASTPTQTRLVIDLGPVPIPPHSHAQWQCLLE